MDIEQAFQNAFGRKSNEFILKKEKRKREDEKFTKKKFSKDVFIRLRIYQEDLEKYDNYFIKYNVKKNKKILKDFVSLLKEHELDDIINIDDNFNFDTTTFSLSDIEIINSFTDLDGDIYSFFKIKKGKLSGDFNKQIRKLNKIINNVDFDIEGNPEDDLDEITKLKRERYIKCCQELEYQDDGLYGWILKRITNRSFMDDL